ncbi:MAG: hypothetical protein A3F72_06810 [Bacteroidetes bacterium RIFCSPLOWO2_12_FULL_35_15]|nr:MAG: hypothetical protein A3F72_06810 [Bacteroidetes bacterium RIFCSPLOWO2_12_FULL_35_15]
MKKIILSAAFFIIIYFAHAQSKFIIYFDSNKSELKKDSKHLLDSLVNVVEKTKSFQVLINAHCDNAGSDQQNQSLSEMRADAVFNYLENKNIGSQFMIKKGFGETLPVANNDNENGKAKNRRAEISVTINEPISIQASSAPPDIVYKTEELKNSNTLNDLEVGKTLILKNLNFEGGTAILLPEAKPSLELLLRTMIENPTLEIEIAGHVCCANDMPLSVLRAKTVYTYLVKKGINEKRMGYKGYSRNKPIFEDDNNETNARANRRVEITILKK